MQPRPMDDTSRPLFPSLRFCIRFFLRRPLGFKRRHINREAVLYVGLEHSFVGVIDLLGGDDFDVGGDVVLAAEVEHLLSFLNSANGGTGEAAPRKDQSESGNWHWLFRSADQRNVAITPEQLNVAIDVV